MGDELVTGLARNLLHILQSDSAIIDTSSGRGGLTPRFHCRRRRRRDWRALRLGGHLRCPHDSRLRHLLLKPTAETLKTSDFVAVDSTSGTCPFAAVPGPTYTRLN